ESFPAQLRPRRLCGLSGGPAGPGACGAGPPPASGGFSLVRRCGPVPVPGFWPVFGRVSLSPHHLGRRREDGTMLLCPEAGQRV
ncbi:MAG: hypothetical protein ABSC31_16525, partial [Acidimicrobiales bacterium]